MVLLKIDEESQNDFLCTECNKLNDNILLEKHKISIGDYIKLDYNQIAIIIEKSKVYDIKEKEGIYKLVSQENLDNEFLNQWNDLKIRDAEKEELSVVFINKNRITKNKYVIDEPIKIKCINNNKYSKVKVTLEGLYDFEIVDTRAFISKLIGLRMTYTKLELIEKIRKYIHGSIEKGINEIVSEYRFDIDTLIENSKRVEIKLEENIYDLKLLEFGIKLTYFDITKIDIKKRKIRFFK